MVFVVVVVEISRDGLVVVVMSKSLLYDMARTGRCTRRWCACWLARGAQIDLLLVHTYSIKNTWNGRCRRRG